MTGGELTVEPQVARSDEVSSDEPTPRSVHARSGQAAHPGAEAVARLQQRLEAVPARPDPAGDAASGVGVWNLANALTGFRIVLVPIFAVLLFAGTGHETGWRIAAWGAFATAAFTDRLDGQIARSGAWSPSSASWQIRSLTRRWSAPRSSGCPCWATCRGGSQRSCWRVRSG